MLEPAAGGKISGGAPAAGSSIFIFVADCYDLRGRVVAQIAEVGAAHESQAADSEAQRLGCIHLMLTC
jgi:hypothetical protein